MRRLLVCVDVGALDTDGTLFLELQKGVLARTELSDVGLHAVLGPKNWS